MTIDQSEALRRFKALGLKDAEHWLDPYTQKGIFGALEEGKITAEEFRMELGKLVGQELTHSQCRHAWHGYCKEVPEERLLMLKELRQKGYRLILLSNTNPYMMDWAMSSSFDGKGNPLSHYFDGLYMSYKLKVMKPAEAFFQHIVKEERIEPKETIFVDDGQRNIDVAKGLGFHTFLAENGKSCKAGLLRAIESID